jgi:hypothetical protein
MDESTDGTGKRSCTPHVILSKKIRNLEANCRIYGHSKIDCLSKPLKRATNAQVRCLLMTLHTCVPDIMSVDHFKDG